MKLARTIGVLVLVQLALVGVYLAVQSGGPAPAPFAFETLNDPVPALPIERAGRTLTGPTDTHLVHFWATWCGPCEAELPGLLESTESIGVPLVAVTDEPWPLVDRYFDHKVPNSIVRDSSGEAAARWRVSGLPDTFVVRDGVIVARMGGPRDWRTPEARAFLQQLRSTP